ncbi:hypothetical protein [Streptomyces sp. NPDC005438]|uniref:hypothetical protein n=1 Tax=Streptomyces sp. NPDC005438 TaxID=3156880 RepID=UPI0033A180DB
MLTRLRVTGRLHLTGRGTTVTVLVTHGEKPVRTGDLLTEDSTGTTVRIRGIETHSRPTPEGTVYGVAITESTPGSVQPGSTLTAAT